MEASEELSVLRAANAALKQRVQELEEVIRRLEGQKNQNSTNSSRPPSSDPPGVKKQRRRRSRRKVGGQPGHRGHSRRLAETADQVVLCDIDAVCPDCGGSGICERRTRRHHVEELVEKPTRLTEYRVVSGRCSRCRKRRRGRLPAGVTPQSIGPRLQAVMVHLTGTLGVSRRQSVAFVAEVLGVKRSRATLSSTEARLSKVLEPTVDGIRDAIVQSPLMHLDETGHRRCGKRCTTWVLSTPKLATFYVGQRRDRKTLHRIQGNAFKGISVTDRYVVYDSVPDGRRQLCLEHLRRNFFGLVDDPTHGVLAHRCYTAVRTVLRLWRLHRAAALSTPRYRYHVQRCRNRLEHELGQHRFTGKLKTLAHTFIQRAASVWLFVDTPDIPPTNNAAERDIRPYVIRRKTSLHTWSLRGDRFLERALTVAISCRKLHRNPFAFLVDAFSAAIAGNSAPLLLPTT
ncbi:MAG: IS66 family transposase [Bdellovibrionales bacterium]|nr:IS66 family transposase [Bdellovibrionales bacterium]